MSEVNKSIPFVYWANCDDPDYSSVCWHREDALTEINDHGGTLYELSHTSDLDRVTAERDALQVLLTAADERADVLETALKKINARCVAYIEAEREMPEPSVEVCQMIASAALKPAEPATDEHVCTGCGAKGWTANCSECVPY